MLPSVRSGAAPLVTTAASPMADALVASIAVQNDRVDPDLAERSRRIDAAELGRRLRRARVLAGLTQVQVAGPDVSGAYLSRIEDGARRPGFELLCRMSERLGVAVEDLLGESTHDEVVRLQVWLDHAELLLVSGKAAEALESIDSVLACLPDTGPGAELRRPANRVRAGALEATGDLDGAIVVLEDLTAEPSASGDWLRALIALSRCYRDTGDFGRAIDVGERAAATVSRLGLDGLTEAIQLSVTVAGAYMIKGDLNRAMQMCLRAIEKADKVNSTLGKASAYWNASLIETRNGAHGSALHLARRAMSYYEVSEELRNQARLRAQIATLQLRQDPPDPDGALATLDMAEREMAWSDATSLDQARALLTRARAHFLRGDLPEARRHLDRCHELAPPSAPLIRASIDALASHIAMSEDERDTARSLALSAAATLTAMGADRDAAKLWFEVGTMLVQVGESTAALDAFRRAGASTGLTAELPSPVSSPHTR